MQIILIKDLNKGIAKVTIFDKILWSSSDIYYIENKILSLFKKKIDLKFKIFFPRKRLKLPQR